jgi:hypothetical protein
MAPDNFEPNHTFNHEKVGEKHILPHIKVEDPPFVSFSNSEIRGMTDKLDTFIKCRICSQMHLIEYGKVQEKDGTFVESEALQYTKCANGALYLVGIYGKKINKWG